jgi:hypothetical protein
MEREMVSDKEREIAELHRGMLSNPDWMIPISRALHCELNWILALVRSTFSGIA